MAKKRTCAEAKRDFKTKMIKANPDVAIRCIRELGITKAAVKKGLSKKAVSRVVACMATKRTWFKAAWVRSLLKDCAK